MTTYSFRSESESLKYGNSTVQVQTDAQQIGDIVSQFEAFLRACGFSFERVEVITKAEENL